MRNRDGRELSGPSADEYADGFEAGWFYTAGQEGGYTGHGPPASALEHVWWAAYDDGSAARLAWNDVAERGASADAHPAPRFWRYDPW